MRRSIGFLAQSNRDLLYRVGSDPAGKLVMLELAMFSGAARGTSAPPQFPGYHPEDVIGYAHITLGPSKWLEAAAFFAIRPDVNDVDLYALSRDLAVAPACMRGSSPESTPSQLLTCFGLALATELLARLGQNVEAATLSLLATDGGSGRLIRYYERKYGLVRQPPPASATPEETPSELMEGSLTTALQKCGETWRTWPTNPLMMLSRALLPLTNRIWPRRPDGAWSS